MLPSIEHQRCIQEIPYRLPSRSHTYGGMNGKRNSISRAFTNLDFYTERRNDEKNDVVKNVRITPILFTNTEEFNSRRYDCKTSYNDLYIFRNKEPLNQIDKIIKSTQKLIWIDEFKQWIIEDPSFVDFIHFAKKSTLFENDTLQEIKLKMKAPVQIEFCERFSKHLNLKVEKNLYNSLKTSKSKKMKTIKSQSNIKIIKKEELQNYKLQSLSTEIECKEDEYQAYSDQASMLDSKDSINQYISTDQNEDLRKENGLKNVESDNNISYKENVEYLTFEVETPKPDIESARLFPDTSDQESCSMDITKEQCSPVTETIIKSNNVEQIIENVNYNNIEIEKNEDRMLTSAEEMHLLSQRHTSEKIQFNSCSQISENTKIKTQTNLNTKITSTSLKINEKKASTIKRVTINESVKIVEPDNVIKVLSEKNEFIHNESLKSLELNFNKEKILNHSEVNETERDKMANLITKRKKRWGKKKLDSSYAELIEKERIAELRKLKIQKKLQIAVKTIRHQKYCDIPNNPKFESYGFLAKYCILKRINVDLYHHTFEVCDENNKQWLTEEELMMALRGVNPQLRDYDIKHLKMVMKTCDYDMKLGADFKLFAVLAALSVQITSLDSWIKNYIGDCDFEILQLKVLNCKRLWECLVDPISNTISLNSLCIELQAGGVTMKHIAEVRKTLSKNGDLTLIDFLTYIPLFIIMHMSILDNPLDMTEKI